MWLEFSFESDGDIVHVYSADQARELVEAGALRPDTPVTVYPRDGAPRLMLAGSLAQIGFAAPPPVDPQPDEPAGARRTSSEPSQNASSHPVEHLAKQQDPPVRKQKPEDGQATDTPAVGSSGRHAHKEQERAADPQRTVRTAPLPPPPIPAPPRPDPLRGSRPAPRPGTLRWWLGGAAALFALLIMVIAGTGSGETRWLVRDAPLFAEADADSELPLTLTAGTQVEVEAVDGSPNWFRIVAGEHDGRYVHAVDLATIDPGMADAADADADAKEGAMPAATETVADSTVPAPEPPPAIARPPVPPRERTADLPPRCRGFTSWVDQQLCRSADLAEVNRRLEATHAEAVRILGSAAAGPSPSATRGRLASCNPDPACLSNGIAARIRDIDVMVGNAKNTQAAAAAAAAVDRSRPATPRGNPNAWITNDDYPSSALRDGAEGMTSVRLTIDTSGRVDSCEVTSPSGNAALDQAACRNLQRRGRFSPALDQSGQPTVGSYSRRVIWNIPEE